MKIKVKIVVVCKKLKNFFRKTENGKDSLNWVRVSVATVIVLLGAGLLGMIFSKNDDTSVLARSDKSLLPEGTNANETMKTMSPAVAQVIGNGNGTRSEAKSGGGGGNINFRASQVIVRDNSGDPDKTVPIGTNLIGKTMTSIDSREPSQLVKILLPYGGRSKGGAAIAKNTVLFGTPSYSGKGDKVTILISKGLSPDGKEFALEAQALSPGDYSPGLAGESHSKADSRLLGAIGLSIVAATSDILTERETMAMGMTAPKVTASNVIYRGVSQSAQTEANRVSEKVGENDDYVTVPVGSDVIISLTKSYVEQDVESQTKR